LWIIQRPKNFCLPKETLKIFSIVQKVRHEIFFNNNLIKSQSLSMVMELMKKKQKERDHNLVKF